MNLNYVFSNDQERLKQAEAQGYDLDTLLMLTKDMFSALDELGLSNKESAEAFYRLKNLHDAAQGRAPDPEVVLYENNAVNPSRLSVENKVSGRTLFFRVVPGQAKVEKTALLVKCESCPDSEAIRRSEVKQHVLDRHRS